MGGGQEETELTLRRSKLDKARKDKKCLFRTRRTDIEKELKHYGDVFSGKVVLCNCNDGINSEFFQYFMLKFDSLNIRKLICTTFTGDESYGADGSKKTKKRCKTSDETNEDSKVAYKLEMYIKEQRKTVEFQELKLGGYFADTEMLALLEQCDIVVTNPPFSQFRDFVKLLVDRKKLFIILGNINAVSYSGVFPLIKENKIWLGANESTGSMWFKIEGEYTGKSSNESKDEDGNTIVPVTGARWYTNIEHDRMPVFAELGIEYIGQFDKYDEYDAINIDKAKDIPYNYYGEMGVPITFLDKCNREQFEIVGLLKNGTSNMYELGASNVNGKQKYARIVIKRKDVEES